MRVAIFITAVTVVVGACSPAPAGSIDAWHAPASGTSQLGAVQHAWPGWQIVKVSNIPRHDVLNDVTVLPGGTVWAVGQRDVDGVNRGVVERFDGRSWTSIANSPPFGLKVITAISDSDVWVFGSSLAVHWNGRSWTNHSLGGSLGGGFTATGAAGVRATDVWAVSPSVPTARHWNGTTWASVPVPGLLRAIDAHAGGEVWAAGRNGQQPLVIRWNGTAWAEVPLPALKLPSADALATLDDIAVLGPKDVWAVGSLSWNRPEETHSRSLSAHWDGTTWTMAVGTVDGQQLRKVEADGTGGLWIVESKWNPTLWHVTGKTWTKVPLPSTARTAAARRDTVLSSLARQPGTATVWAVGSTARDDLSANGTFWRIS
ncbi:hypothetical protein IMZ11_07205 [Microtetraspora sp. AC03309]|uniref:hypothetical protein n=1 Tax=Microtetraspora sp. AC03309 TaxID=2779376 RepID=UPI001E3E3658|nr:hypothetical protein [Microtetraspora sp. AC03309]MCC5575429.1 hypothetical protein [Microtetraspora sp. AC03309]